MRLSSITVENYRSIEKDTIKNDEINGSYTYTLIGINESGKSSFLKAISLKDTEETPLYPQDFCDTEKPIELTFDYSLSTKEAKQIKEKATELGLPKELLNKVSISKVILKVIFPPNNADFQEKAELEIKDNIFSEYTNNGTAIVKKDGTEGQEDFNLKAFLEDKLQNIFFEMSHQTVFWKSESKYLITEPINLDEFAANPETISIPLRNCFELAGVINVQNEINKIKADPAEMHNLQEKLGKKVTEHIKSVWPGHPIKIRFQISGTTLTFLVEDDGVEYKAKVTAQRSDGFRQFVSFLLTVSAESNNGKLSDSILLLDEPETHLHPKGQENLRDELIKITKNGNNNVAIFATHSNYMIDKNYIDRCYRVVKEDNKTTRLNQFKNTETSYSEVNYVVFDIPTNDYHNELYGFLEDTDKPKLEGLEQSLTWKNEKTKQDENVSLPKYIRNQIHHPENTKNKKFTPDELVRSIKILRKLKYGKE